MAGAASNPASRLSNAAPAIEPQHSSLLLRVRPGTDEAKRQAIVDGWYRQQVKLAAAPLVARWEPVMGVKVSAVFVQRMKTQWGSCNHGSRSIRLNTDLARKPREYLEYILVHEMAHLLEPTHNARFVALMDQFMPNWQVRREQLNRLPVRHEVWGY